MITKYDTYKKVLENNTTDEYNRIKKAIQTLLDDGDIVLGDGKTLDDVLSKFIPKSQKYDTFSFERFMIELSEGKGFFSESVKKNMGEYIQKIKDMGIDTSKLEELYPSYEKQRELILSGDERIIHDSELSKDERIKKLEELDDEIESLEKDREDFVNELVRISPLVVEKL